MIGPAEYELNTMGDFTKKKIAMVYKEYQTVLKKNNALDFDDLIVKTVELFKACPEVLNSYQERFRYIMVDEYQDTNTAQFELIRLLAQKYRNLCVVGDDDQSIYKFRGANIRNILDFEKTYADAKVIKTTLMRRRSILLRKWRERLKEERRITGIARCCTGLMRRPGFWRNVLLWRAYPMMW